MSLPSDARAAPVKATHQRFILADPIAFRYLEEDPSTQVLARRQTLSGYECYLVEQWACSRTDPTFVITTYTGDPSHSIVVSVLSVPTDEKTWSPRLKVYFKALSQYHARRRDTPLGTIMITNLSGFPSSLTVIPVPNGDIKTHREDFFVNENLKRLGCSGRVGFTLSKPSPATVAKFYQLYRASDKIPLNSAVIELVKLCQVALMLFGKLEPDYADGLLCDVTEKSINDWWVEFGTEYYNVEPHDGILGPTTVAALLGMLLGARNRLHAYGSPISKDVFDIDGTKRAIAYFQKSHRLQKTRRLDRLTLARLHRSTAKAASGEGWFVPRAVKSTVAELSGKGGEMVMDIVGGRDRAGIAAVETVDIEQFVQHVHGERSKWLWQGKPRKAVTGDIFRRAPGDDLTDQQSNEKADQEWPPRRKGTSVDSDQNDDREKVKLVKRPPDRTNNGKPQDSRRGFGRIKDAVGRRNHPSKHSKDETDRIDHTLSARDSSEMSRVASANQNIQPTPRSHPDGVLHQIPSQPTPLEPAATFTSTITETPLDAESSYFERIEPPPENEGPVELEATISYARTTSRSPTASIAGSNYRGVDLEELFVGNALPDDDVGVHLRRTQSYSRYEQARSTNNKARWPRHLSFSLAEDSVLSWASLCDQSTDQQSQTLPIYSSAETSKRLREQLLDLEFSVASWVKSEVMTFQEVDILLGRDREELSNLYYARLEEYRNLTANSKGLMDEERGQLDEAAKQIEQLGAKLEYEINGLRGKVEDVEEGVAEFKRQVIMVEDRVLELEKAMQPKEGWIHLLRRLTGMGKLEDP